MFYRALQDRELSERRRERANWTEEAAASSPDIPALFLGVGSPTWKPRHLPFLIAPIISDTLSVSENGRGKVLRSKMEENSIGLVVGLDGAVHSSRPQNPMTEGFLPPPMAGDPAFFASDMGSSILNNKFNEGFRAGDLSVRTGEEFFAPFSHLGIKGNGRPEGKAVLYQMRVGKRDMEGDGNPYGYQELTGIRDAGGPMASSDTCVTVGERGNMTAEFRNDYSNVYSEPARAPQFFRTGDEVESQSDDGSVRRAEFQRISAASMHQDHLSVAASASDDVGSHKVKFMCSFGGKILPRPSDGNLRYVGGETRIITVNRSIGFMELMKKMMDIYGQALLLKYQLPDEDLDALVSVSSDEDLENMMDEYERLLEGSSEGSSRLRVFLFSAVDYDLSHPSAMSDPRNSEQWYVDAVNGINETGFRKHEDSITSASSQHLENLIGLDFADNWSSAARDAEGMSTTMLSSKVIPQDVANLGQLPPSPSLSSKQAISKVHSITSSTPSSPPLSSLTTHLKQSGVGDVPVPSSFSDQQSKIGGHLYSTLHPVDGGSVYRDLDYGGPIPSTAALQNELHLRVAGSRREAESSTQAHYDYLYPPLSHPDMMYVGDRQLNDPKLPRDDSQGKLNLQQEKFEDTQPMVDCRCEGQLPPLDSQYIVPQQPTHPMHWQPYVDAHHDTYRRLDYLQHANPDSGHTQQLFQQHIPQGAYLNNHQLSGHERSIYMNVNQAQQQHLDDVLGGPYVHKFVSTHPPVHMVATAASLQHQGSAPSSPHLTGQQIVGGQQHVQVHHHPNVPYLEQQPYLARVAYYNAPTNRVFRPSPSPPRYGQVFEQFGHQQESPLEWSSHPEEQINPQLKIPREQVSHDDFYIHQQAMPHAHSDSVLQEHAMKPVYPMYEGIPVSQGHHSDGSARLVPSYATSSTLQEGLISYQDCQDMSDRSGQIAHEGKESRPVISGQQGHTIARGGMDHIVEEPSPRHHFHEMPDESDWVLQHRTQALDEAKLHFATQARLTQSEGKEERSAELLGSHLVDPVVSYGVIGLSEGLHAFSGPGLSESYQTHQQAEMIEAFGPTSYQLKQPFNSGDLGVIGILPNALQAARLNGRMNEVAVPRSGTFAQEVRATHPEERGMAHQAGNIAPLFSVGQRPVEERLGGIAFSPILSNSRREPYVSSSMSVALLDGNLGADHAKVEILKHTGDLGEDQSQDASPLLTNNEMSMHGGSNSMLDGSYDVISVDDSLSNSTHIAERCPAQYLEEITTAGDSGHSSFLHLDSLANARSLDKSNLSNSNLGTVTLPESISIQGTEQHSVQIQGKGIIDDESGHSACALTDLQSNTISLDEGKGGGPNSPAAVLPVNNSNSDSLRDLIKDSSAPTNVLAGKASDAPANDNSSLSSNNAAAIGLHIGEDRRSQEMYSKKDSHGKELPSQTLPLSDVKVEGTVDSSLNEISCPDTSAHLKIIIVASTHASAHLKNRIVALTHVVCHDHPDDNVKGELQNVAEDVAAAALRPPLHPAPTLSVHEWHQASEEVKVQDHSSLEKVPKETEEERVLNSDLNFEESNAEDLDKDEPKAVIAEAIKHGLQTIKNADLEELRELGSGTFGTVYHGKWRGSDVAIKRIKNSCFMGKPSEQKQMRADFWREACMLAQLHHPNVVAFYGVVPDGPGGTLATVTEYMVNGSLKQVMQRKDRTIDRRKRLLIAMDAAFGMEYLHGKNIVHFDLKCENLLVNMRDTQRPICKVGDLGLSKIKHQTLVTGGVRGTLPWMAPELLNGSSNLVSEKVDVFSFGIVMWELLTGDEPYANMHYGAIIGGIVNNTLRPPVPNCCDPAWRSLMERCWSADPSARPTFTEITNELRAMAASLPPKGQAHQAHGPTHPQN
eukprot:Gb_25639 [translate_table: standard]